MYDESIITTVIAVGVFWNLLSMLVPIAVIVFIVWMTMKSRNQAAVNQFTGFQPAMMDLERLLQAVAQAQGHISPAQRSQFTGAFMRAQSELNQLDALRREQSELRLADMRGQAASLGIFMD
jgi:hypothetical protein